MKKICCILLSFFLVFPFTLTGKSSKWVATWATAMQLVEPGNMPPDPGLSNNTLRQTICISVGGDIIRLKLSNLYSKSSVTIKSVMVAHSKGGRIIEEHSQQNVLFGGHQDIILQGGEEVLSDETLFSVNSREELVITILFGEMSSTVTGHPGSRTTSYLLEGDHVKDPLFNEAIKTDHWYMINRVDVLSKSSTAAVAIIGNSITDGRGSTTNMQNRWTDVLAARLLNNNKTSDVAVLNLGIGGNCVLSGGLGPTALSRFGNDVLQQPGVKWVILFEGVNDIGNSRNTEKTAKELIDAFENMADKAHAQGLKVYGCTITPFGKSFYYSPEKESCRNQVNAWIRNTNKLDAVIDFDKTMRHPQSEDTLLEDLQDSDYLHPNALGHKRMGMAVALNLFE